MTSGLTYPCLNGTEPGDRIEQLLSRAFVAAQLLTANKEQAEGAVIAGIDEWDPEEGTEEALLQHVLTAASRDAQCSADPQDEPLSTSTLPTELQTVLLLAAPLRRPFVLRVLLGLPREVCAHLLRLTSVEVDRFTAAAVSSLASLARIKKSRE